MGHTEIIKGITFDNRNKDIYVYTPDTGGTPPLVLIYDGQFVFDLYPSKEPFGINFTADTLVEDGMLPPITIVGITSDQHRMKELNPWIHLHCQNFLTNTVLPYLEKHFHVKRPYINIGFSFGGQMAIYMTRFAGIFDRAGAVLPLWTPRESKETPQHDGFTYIIARDKDDATMFEKLLKNNIKVDVLENAEHSTTFFRTILPHMLEVLTRDI